MIGLDTTAIIDLFKGKKEIKELLDKFLEPLVVTQLSYLELMFGIIPENKRHQLEEKYYDEFFNSIPTLQLTNLACKKASELNYRLKKNGAEVEKFDCVIAGILLVNGITTIITRNKKDFEKIPGLRVLGY